MIARTETHSDRERILALLSPRSTDACVRQVFADIDEINRLMEYYSFRTPQLADRFVKDPHELVKAGDVVKVRVVEVDVKRKRIALTMRRDGGEAPQPSMRDARGSANAMRHANAKPPAKPETPAMGGLGAALAEAMRKK